MSETNDQIDITTEDVQGGDLTQEQLADETIDWRAKAQELEGIAKRRATKLEKIKTKLGAMETALASFKNEGKPQDKKQEGGLNYAEKAYLKSSGINADEFAIVEGIMKETGKDIDTILQSRYFQSDLKDHRDKKAVESAIPDVAKRNGQPASTQIEYWLAKGNHELPPNTAENRILRGQIVEARYQREKMSSQFTDNPIVE